MNIPSDRNASRSSTTTGNGRVMHSKTAIWPSEFSRILAATCCTLGLFNISRFSIFSILFGANFIVQFLILSLFFGIPMLWLQMCLGNNIKDGPVSMWRVSPICQGIGIALVLVQTLMAIYSAISLAWVLIYLRDSCVSARYPWYRWQEAFEFFRGPSENDIANIWNTTKPSATSSKLGETVSDYFNGVVLQRYQLGPGSRASNGIGFGAIRFQLAFNLAVLWLLVFIVLSKGLRSYGKILVAIMSMALIGLFALCIKMLTLLNLNSFQNIFPATDWQDFFVSSQSWLSAAQEVFLTWSLLGASIISIFSKSTKCSREANTTVLRRDAFLVVIFTLVGLILAAIIGNACVQILHDRGFYYFPGSFETITSSVFLLPSSKPLPPQLATSLSKSLPRYSTMLGESYRRIDPNSIESGWQAIRLVTELFPATLAAATHDSISSFWSLLGFFVFFFFGIAQLCTMWKPIAASLDKYSESISATSTTVLLTCLTGLLLGIPLTTESGINIIYFLDSVIGGAWFVLLLWTGQIFAIFLVRGRPYSGDILVNDLRLGQTLSAFVALSWNILLPTALLTLCTLQYKISYSHDFYHWSGIIASSYWPMWVRKMAAFIQIGIFQIVPITAIFQTYRYLTKGPPDILDRFQLLYRPSISSSQTTHRYPLPRSERAEARTNDAQGDMDSSTVLPIAVILENSPASLTFNDAPPKYTPPPSYTIATGARIAKMLRKSFRRSVRRILGEGSSNNRRQRASIPTENHTELAIDQYQLPPAYSTILPSDMNGTSGNTVANSNNRALEQHQYEAGDMTNVITVNEQGPRHLFNSEIYRQQAVNGRRHTTTNFPSYEKIDSFSFTIPRRVRTDVATTNELCHHRNLSAHDVVQLLRPTPNAQCLIPCFDQAQINIDDTRQKCDTIIPLETNYVTDNQSNSTQNVQEQGDCSLTRSIEELIINEVAVGESSAVAPLCLNNLNGDDDADAVGVKGNCDDDADAENTVQERKSCNQL